ncbi:hypothetical protein HNP46_007115 [Pseudomonas nitritireducens]|uniref:Uncharacterized protein n=1 Tax=Pseudomonas nitroreducens TaxID=46680 RepID=A0A7W7KSL6_PSENT|nr:hypothetical protein [Pseudomonas nitritireducens]MBB4868195.1 hypothetical protein [Pseudomonas nitritireducens]
MQIFLVSQEAALGELPEVVNHLAKVNVPRTLSTPVIVIDECLWRAEKGSQISYLRAFKLDDFIHPIGRITDGGVTADSNVIGEKLCAAEEPWLVIDLGLHNQLSVKDFIWKLAVFNFHFRGLQEKHLVILTPRLHLGQTGRYVNDTFNNLSKSLGTREYSDRFNILQLSILIEKLSSKSVLTAWLFSKAQQLVRYFYLRLIDLRAK